MAECKPWDRDDYARRVQTYSVFRWFGKPNIISPLEVRERSFLKFFFVDAHE
jgi:hypothetical protein